MTQAPGRRKASHEATRQRVLDAARSVFAERGVNGASVEDICKAAGFTRGAFYSNFPDKPAIVRELLEMEYERVIAFLDGVLSLPEEDLLTPEERASELSGAIAHIVERLLATVPIDRTVLLALTEFELGAIRDPAIARDYGSIATALRSRIADFLVRGFARLGRELTVEPLDAADAILGICERSSRRALMSPELGDANALAAAMLPPFVIAISRERPAPIQ